jgi:hypothetical protein
MASTADHDPRHHTQKTLRRLKETIDHLREDIEKVDEPQLKAMFETSAEILGGQGLLRLRAEERKRMAKLMCALAASASAPGQRARP